ncbi:MAG: hypothetical protein ABFS39_16945 [Pseudomonadota bacterium]
MSEQKNMGAASRFIAIVIAFVVVLGVFYGLDHFIMSIQGLPLNADLTPAG